MQVTLSLNATSNVVGAENAVTSSADIDGVLILAASQANITYGGTSVQVVTRCGDGICSPGEPLQKNQDNTGKCGEDCPFIIGECEAPPASGVGDPTLQCGGNGICNPSNLRCDCYAGYAVRPMPMPRDVWLLLRMTLLQTCVHCDATALQSLVCTAWLSSHLAAQGDACEYCGDGYGRNGQRCEIVVSALTTTDTPPDAAAPGPTSGTPLTSPPPQATRLVRGPTSHHDAVLVS